MSEDMWKEKMIFEMCGLLGEIEGCFYSEAKDEKTMDLFDEVVERMKTCLYQLGRKLDNEDRMKRMGLKNKKTPWTYE